MSRRSRGILVPERVWVAAGRRSLMDIGHVLFNILAVLLAAKTAAEVSERVGIPPVVGEICAGILIGPSVLGMVEGDEVLHVLGELGVILLLLEVGLQMDLGELGAVGRASLSVALLGVALPFTLGTGVAAALGSDGTTAVFVGAALTATSVGITARVFGDLRALASIEARTVLGAAVADDVLGLVILTVVVRVVSGGSVTVASVGEIVLVAVVFLVVTAWAGLRLAPPLFRWVQVQARSGGTLVAVAFAFALVFAQLADAARLAPIVGAFVAGLCLARSAQADRIRRELAPVGHLFVPVFFLQIGIATDVGQLARPQVLGVAGALLLVAVIGKVGASLGSGRFGGDRLVVGLGMLPRGEVGLIFAGIGLREGVLGEDLYAALLLVVLATTLMAPPLLRWRLGALQERRTGAARPAQEPDGGWLRVADGVVDLVGPPPAHAALHVTLAAATLAARARPGPALLDWVGGLPSGPLRWDARATVQLFDVLRNGNTRSWRLLEMTGVLERALPELAHAVTRRRADPFELDPTQTFRWELVDRLHHLLASDPVAAAEHAQLEHPEWLLLAALVADVTRDAAPEVAVPTARRLVKHLGLGAGAEQEIALLVGETALLRGVAARAGGLTEASVLQVATHLATPERARALYLLTLAADGLDTVRRARLDELHGLVQRVLLDPLRTGRQARNVLEARRAAAAGLVVDRAVTERIAAAPAAFVVSQDAAALARQATLLEPLPASSARVRVAVTPVPSEGTWTVDVAARDRHGLLAAVTGGLSTAGLDIVEASVATWGDGGVVETFRVRSPRPPDPAHLTGLITAALDAAWDSPPLPDAAIDFDDDGSPWYTLCSIAAGDRPGLLHAVAQALAAAGVDVHSARIVTRDGVASDVFELTDRHGCKLDERARTAVRTTIAAGARARARRLRSPRRAPRPPASVRLQET